MINQSFVFPVLAAAAAAAAAARHTIRSKITLQPSCLSTNSLCCAEHSCSMAWPSSIPEPSPKLAPQQQVKSSPYAGFTQSLCSQPVLSKEGCSRVPFIVETVLVVTTLSCSLSHLLRCSALCVAGAQAAAARPEGAACLLCTPPRPFTIWDLEWGCKRSRFVANRSCRKRVVAGFPSSWRLCSL